MNRRGRQDRRLVGGLHPVRELLRSRQPVTRLLVATGREGTAVLDEILRLAAERSVPVEEVDRRRLDQLTEGLVHQGVVMVGPPFPYVPLPRVLEGALAAPEPALLVALDQITDPHNLGSIARSADALGAHGLLIPARRTASVTATAEKAAAGALAHLPLAAVTNLARALAELRDAGVWSLGLDGEAAAELAQHPLVTEPCVLVVGAEGAGLSRLTRERCDALVRLPMRGHVSSLNASVAAGVALATIQQRREPPRT